MSRVFFGQSAPTTILSICSMIDRAHLSGGCLPALIAFKTAVITSNPITMAELISHPFQVKPHILADSYGRRERSTLSLMMKIADPTSTPSMNGMSK